MNSNDVKEMEALKAEFIKTAKEVRAQVLELNADAERRAQEKKKELLE